MRNSELKSLIKTSYLFKESSSEKAFLRTHEQRSMQLLDVLKNEISFLDMKSMSFGALLFVLLLCISLQNTINSVWRASSLLPLFVLILGTLINRSERYNMAELEASCRFSLRFVRLVRMLILGLISMVMILISTFVIRHKSDVNFLILLCTLAAPYLFNVLGCLYATRKLNGKKDLLACAVITGCTCAIPSIFHALKNVIVLGNMVIGLVTLVVLLMTIIESIIYIKEGGNIEWNYC